jgi:hypothetical protein
MRCARFLQESKAAGLRLWLTHAPATKQLYQSDYGTQSGSVRNFGTPDSRRESPML